MPKVFKSRAERRFDRSWAEIKGLPPMKPGRVDETTPSLQGAVGWPDIEVSGPCFGKDIFPSCLEEATIRVPLYTWREIIKAGIPIQERDDRFCLLACGLCFEYRKYADPKNPIKIGMVEAEASQIRACEEVVEGWEADGHIIHCELWPGEPLPEELEQYIGAILVYADYTGLRSKPEPGPLVLTLWTQVPYVDINSPQ